MAQERRKSRIVSWLALAVLMAGCISTANTEAVLKSWVGAPIDKLIGSWGPPQSTYVLPGGGGTIYTWMRTGPVTTTVIVNPLMPMATTGQRWCKYEMRTNAQGTVTGWRWEGNMCAGPKG